MLSRSVARPLVLAPLAAGLALSLAGLSGCVVAVGNTTRSSEASRTNDVPESLMTDIVASTRFVETGSPKHEVLDRYPPRLVSKFSAAEVDGRFVEEFRVLAYDRRNTTRFERWLYFVDGQLRAFDSERLDEHALSGLFNPNQRYEFKPDSGD